MMGEQRIRAPGAKQNDCFIEVLSGKMVSAGFYHKDLADRLGISESALHYKLKDPNRFTLREVKSTFRILDYTSEDIRRSFQ